MARRLPLRPMKVAGNLFVLVQLSFISFIYYTYVFLVWGPLTAFSSEMNRCETVSDYSCKSAIAVLTIFHLLFILLIWSLVQSMITDPGQVPVFWGFHQGDNEKKRRRYCLQCNVFKPERCHHCSACNRCVLNMDHHCPWINNCVGF